MKRLAGLILLAWMVSVSPLGLSPAWAGDHTPLKLQNTFKTPEEVLRHFLARDSEGFVWAGLMESEREAFTTWKRSPRLDAHFLADKFSVKAEAGALSDSARFVVTYEHVVQRDSAGTEVPRDPPVLRTAFTLKKLGQAWKIIEPDAERFSPVLLRKSGGQ